MSNVISFSAGRGRRYLQKEIALIQERMGELTEINADIAEEALMHMHNYQYFMQLMHLELDHEEVMEIIFPPKTQLEFDF